MHRYEMSTPRVALGVAAIAMTAVTMGVLVVMPATMQTIRPEPGMVAASKVIAPAPGRAGPGATIDAVALPEPGLAATPCTPPSTEHKRES